MFRPAAPPAAPAPAALAAAAAAATFIVDSHRTTAFGRRHPAFALAVATVATCGLMNADAGASLLLWANAAGGAASTAGNWSPAQSPTSADDLSFGLATAVNVTFNSSVLTSHTLLFRGATATLTMSSPHTASAGVTVGDASSDNGHLTVTTGTLTSNGNVVIGNATGSAGTVIVNDTDADFIVGNGADMIVGSNGDGTLSITNAGHVQVGDQLIAGNNSSSTSTITVSGFHLSPPSSSLLEVLGNSQSRIGQGGDATMNINIGALAHFSGDVVVGNGSASTSSITVETIGLFNARLNVDGDLLLGRNTSATAAGSGTLTLNSGGQATIGGTLFVGGDRNGGTGGLHINAGSTVNATDLQTGTNGTVFMGGGILNCTNPIANNANGVIVGEGTINADINNAGSIILNNAGLTLNGVLSNTTSNLIAGSAIHFGTNGGYSGSGTCAAAIAGDAGSLIDVTGTLSIGQNATNGFFDLGDIHVGGNILTLVDSNGAVLGGTTTIDSGRIECPAGIGVQNGAVISGDGLFTGDMVCSGKLDPEITGPNGGLFTIQGDLIMNPTGSIDIELGGTPGSNHYDRINVTGTASFNGTVYVRLAPGFVPQAGQQFIACNATGGRTGTFTNIVPVDLATHPCTGTTFVMVYSSTAAIILVRPPDADTNDDGFVDVNDLLAVITHWGFCGNSPSEPACDGSNADGTGNGTGTVVDVNDLLVVISHWGSCP